MDDEMAMDYDGLGRLKCVSSVFRILNNFGHCLGTSSRIFSSVIASLDWLKFGKAAF